MTDEDESTNPGIIVAAERAIIRFLRDREANETVPEELFLVFVKENEIGRRLRWPYWLGS